MADLQAPERPIEGRGFQPAGAPGHGLAVPSLRAKVTQPSHTQMLAAPVARLHLAFRGAGHIVRHLIEEEVAYGRAMLLMPVYMGSGAIIWFSAATDPPPQAVFAVLLIFVAGFFWNREANPLLRHLLLAGTLVSCGMALAQWETWRAGTIMLDSPVTTTITGRVEEREADDGGRWRYVVALEATEKPTIRRQPARVTIFVRKQPQPFALGDRIQGRVRLIPAAGPALPGLNDFAFAAYFDGIGANGFAYGAPKLLSPIGDENGGPLNRASLWLTDLRGGIGDRIRSLMPGDVGAFAASLVTDERRAISAGTTDALRTSGLAHIVAISGLNMALSAGIFYVGLRYALSLFFGIAQARPTKKIAAVGALITVTAYYMISGFGVSAERAFIMMAIMLIAVLFDRPSVSLRNVALSAVVILILSPSQVLGPSFQMSYAATLALVSGYTLWTRRKQRDGFLHSLPVMQPVLMASRFFGGILSTSLIGGASTAIFSIEHFHRLATYGLIANLAAMPIVSFVIMPFGMVATLLMPFGLDAPFWQITGAGLEAVIAIAKAVAAWDGNIAFGRLPVWVFPTIVGGFLIMTVMRTRLRHAGPLMIAATILFMTMTSGIPKPDLMISEDGTLVALRYGDILATNREKPPQFIFQQWQRALAITDYQPPAMLQPDGRVPKVTKSDRKRRLNADEQQRVRNAMDAALDQAIESGFACQKGAWCVALLDNGDMLVTIENAAYLGPACDTANIVVTPIRLRLDHCRSGAKIMTGVTLQHSGAIEAALGSGTPMMTPAFQSLSRPWDRQRAYDWRTGTFGISTASALPVNGSVE
jgi:ComEC/Rec2-related protein